MDCRGLRPQANVECPFLKCQFYYCSGVMKLTDQEMIVHENGLFLKGPKRGHVMQGHMGKHHSWSGGRRERMGKNLHCGFHGKIDRLGMGKFEQ